LTRGHGHQPSQERSPCWLNEEQAIGDEKTNRAQQVQGLVDAAMVVIAMIVPTLDPQSF
jgi:hypothetical protein